MTDHIFVKRFLLHRERGKNTPVNIFKIKAAHADHSTQSIHCTGSSAFLCPTDAHFRIKESFFNVNIDDLLFPQEIQAALKNLQLHLFLL